MGPGGRTPLHVGLYHLHIQCTNHATMTAKTQDPTSHSNMILKKIITMMILAQVIETERYKRRVLQIMQTPNEISHYQH